MTDDHHIPEERRLVYKILKNADCIPPEIELKKEIQRTEDLLAGMGETAEKYRALKKINFLIMKLNSIRKTLVELEMPQYYTEKIADRLNEKDNKTRKS